MAASRAVRAGPRAASRRAWRVRAAALRLVRCARQGSARAAHARRATPRASCEREESPRSTGHTHTPVNDFAPRKRTKRDETSFHRF